MKIYIHFNLKETIYLLKELLLFKTNYKNLMNQKNIVIPVVIITNQIIERKSLTYSYKLKIIHVQTFPVKIYIHFNLRESIYLLKE